MSIWSGEAVHDQSDGSRSSEDDRRTQHPKVLGQEFSSVADTKSKSDGSGRSERKDDSSRTSTTRMGHEDRDAKTVFGWCDEPCVHVPRALHPNLRGKLCRHIRIRTLDSALQLVRDNSPQSPVKTRTMGAKMITKVSPRGNKE